MREAAAAGLAVLALALAGAPPAAAAPPPPTGLGIAGGEDSWRAGRSFHVIWKLPSSPPIAAVHWALRRSTGELAAGPVRTGAISAIGNLQVPPAPDAYTLQVWLEDSGGAQGPAAETKLRFDNARPGPTGPRPTAAWIGRADFPLTLRLERPAGPPPLAGIRGYAVSIDPLPGRRPCAAADRCTAAETDLHGGAANDALRVVDLPEGTSHVAAVAVSGSGMASETIGRSVLRVDKTDPVTRLDGAPAGWARGPVRLTATATDSGSGMDAVAGAAAPFTAIGIDGAPPAISLGARVTATVIDEGVHRVVHYARDAAGNVADGGRSNGVVNPQPAVVPVRIDGTAPRVAFAGSQDPREPELIRVRIADALSGPDPSRGWIGVRRAGSGGRFVPLPAAPGPPGELRARWSSEDHPPGRYEFRAVGHDAAGNAAASTRRANGTPMVLPNPIKAATGLSAGLGGRVLVWHSCRRQGEARRCRRREVRRLSVRPAERIVPRGRGALLSGRLSAGIQAPLARMPVRIVERFDRGGPAARVSTAFTDSGGAFTTRLAPGPSREVRAHFAGSPALAPAAGRPVRLGVRGALRLRASAARARVGGAPVVFRGRVLADPGEIPEGGKWVQLQFRVPGLPWSEFRTVQTDTAGRFRYAYRFSNDNSRGVRFQFRAHAPSQGDWPYEPASSRPVAVRGR